MMDLFVKGGPLMWPILLCSILAMAIALKKAWEFWSIWKAVSDDVETVWAKRLSYLEPIRLAIESGRNEKEIGIVGTRQIREMEKGLGVLSLIAVISPLLGLTGTVTGMIEAFQVIAVSQTQVNPGMLAGGIWEALITTAAGLFVAIPTHIAGHFLEERLDQITLIVREAASSAYYRRQHGI
uniref:MotA/TolQ/ExbB proton channel family protein n=1 Tax=Desulfatirhabdium butyrativorans TaxID=340467 RepID=A0A7C4VT67_9BACT